MAHSPSLLTRVLLVPLGALMFATGLAWAAETPAAPEPIRIRAGASAAHTDEAGVKWLPDQGFDDGDMMERPGLDIGNTKTPSVYWAEHFSMTKFRQKLPNGNYTVKLHFAVTYEAIAQAGEVVFSFNVEGRDYKDFDIWAKAGGARQAYIETVPVTIKDGQLDITFTTQKENPTISAIEILPRP